MGAGVACCWIWIWTWAWVLLWESEGSAAGGGSSVAWRAATLWRSWESSCGWWLDRPWVGYTQVTQFLVYLEGGGVYSASVEPSLMTWFLSYEMSDGGGHRLSRHNCQR